MDRRDLINFSEVLPEVDATSLEKVVGMVNPRNPIMVEVGSRKGGSASIIGEYAKKRDGDLYCVDHWIEDYELFNFRLNMKALELGNWVYPMVMPSQAAAHVFADKSLDFVFIDGDHEYSAVMKDLEAWYPKVKIDGIICGHDCERYFHKYPPDEQVVIRKLITEDGRQYAGIHGGVVLAVNDTFAEDYEIMPKSKIWWHKKRRK